MKKGKADIWQGTLRLPRAVAVRIKHVAVDRGISMQQAIQEAILYYCRELERERKGGK
jgi:hypothetical protein